MGTDTDSSDVAAEAADIRRVLGELLVRYQRLMQAAYPGVATHREVNEFMELDARLSRIEETAAFIDEVQGTA